MTVLKLTQTPEFTIRGEFLWFGVILHADVHVRWTRGVRQRFRAAITQIVHSVWLPCFAFQTPSHDPKKRKFIQDVGGTYHHRRLTDEDEWAEMFLFPRLDLSKGEPYG